MEAQNQLHQLHISFSFSQNHLRYFNIATFHHAIILSISLPCTPLLTLTYRGFTLLMAFWIRLTAKQRVTCSQDCHPVEPLWSLCISDLVCLIWNRCSMPLTRNAPSAKLPTPMRHTVCTSLPVGGVVVPIAGISHYRTMRPKIHTCIRVGRIY